MSGISEPSRGIVGERAGEDVVVVEPADDLLARQALRDGDRVQDRLAGGKGVDGLVDAGAGLEQELAGLELPARAVEERIGLEQARAAR